MTFDADTLYALMPAIYRIRDRQMARYPGPCGEPEGPLKALLRVIAGQVALVEDNLAQLYDDQFVETCAEWVVPYIGDLIGVRDLHSMDAAMGALGLPSIGGATLSERADVANTIGYRRRKGTLGVLEPMARDVTGWPARAVEFFRLIAATQFMGHRRLDNHLVDVRRGRQLERLDTPFDSLVHTVDARSIQRREGRYNLPDIGIFLWRLRAYPLTGSPAVPSGTDGRLYRFHPLGIDTPLFARTRTEDEFVDLSIPSQPYNLPGPISRSLLSEHLGELYGAANSLVVTVDGRDLPAGQVAVSDLSTQPNGQWGRGPGGLVGIDPELGRIAFPTGAAPQNVTVSFHYGFSADMGGGEYDRSASLQTDTPEDAGGSPLPVLEVRGGTGIQAALTQLRAGGTVRVMDSGRYEETIRIGAGTGVAIELQAADGCRPTLALDGELRIRGAEGATITLNGLLIEGGRMRLAGRDCSLRLEHCTLVPGLSLHEDGRPRQGDEPSLLVEASGATVELRYSICGGIRAAGDAEVQLTGSIVDATGQELPAYAAPDGVGAGGPLSVDRCTIFGTVHASVLGLASNTIFACRGGHHGGPVRVERRQVGCARYSSLPPGSHTPPRYACQPGRGTDPRLVAPRFTSLRYGTPGYCRLSPRCPVEISQGAADESEMGAFHDLYQPQRVTNLRVRLDEYLRFGLEAGIFFVT